MSDHVYSAARARKMLADAQIAEIELASKRREMVRVDLVVAAWVDVISAVRARIWSMPSKLAPLLATMDDPVRVRETLEIAVREALDELSNYRPEIDAGIVSGKVKEDKEKKGRKGARAKVQSATGKRGPGRPRRAERI